MKKVQRLLSVLLVCCLVAGLLPTAALAADPVVDFGTDGGDCGDNLSWTLDSDGILTISGIGKMNDYPSSNVFQGTIPWYYNRENIVEIQIDEGVTSVGAWAFSGCDNLTNVSLPTTVETIGGGAFYACKHLSEIVIPNKVTTIEYKTFSNCTSLTTVTSKGVTIIGQMAFENCSLVNNIIFSDELVEIGESAFSNCKNLTEIVLPRTADRILSRAFSGCINLSHVVIQARRANYYQGNIYECAFENTSLYSAGPIGSNCNLEFAWDTELPSSAFTGCNSLESVLIPSSITSISGTAFDGCLNLIDISVDEANAAFSSFEGVLFNKDKTLLYRCPAGKVGEYIIPESVTTISNHSFKDCNNLTSIVIPKTLKTIGYDSTFENCGSLTSILLPENVVSWDSIDYDRGDYLGSRTFAGCSKLETVGIPISIKWIAYETFSGCYNLTDVYYPGNEAEWNAISIGSANDALTSATIHYNSTGPDDIGPGEISNGSVQFLSSYDQTIKNVIFNGEESSPYFMAASADVSGIGSLVGKYVLVTMDPDSVLEVVSIQPVESKIGVVSSAGEHSLTIDGTVYPVQENLMLWSLDGEEMLYHIYEGSIAGFDVLEEKTGTLEHFDRGTGILTIDGAGYSISNLVVIFFEDIEAYLLQNVKFVCDNLNHIYRIEIYKDDEKVPVSNFNPDIYRANWMQRSEATVLGINSALSEVTPSAELVSNLLETGFDEAITAWDSFDLISSALDDPTKLADFATEPKDMYSAIILNALEASVSYDIIDSKIENAYKETGKLVSLIKNNMKTEFNLDIYDTIACKDLTGIQRERIVTLSKKWFEEEFDEKYADLNLISNVFDGITKGFKTIGSIEDYCERIVNCVIVAETNEYLKEVLRQAYQDSLNGDNFYLQLALSDCVTIMNSSSEELMMKIIGEEFTAIGVDVGGYFFKELLWKQVKKFIVTEFPAIAVWQQAYKDAKYLANLLVSTDKTIEQYLNMVAVSDIEELLDRSVAKLNRQFNQDKTISTAATYLSGVDFIFTLRDIDTQKAYGFVDVLDTTWWNKIGEFLSGKDNFTDAKSYYRMRQVRYAVEYENFLTAWVNFLDEDYPDSGLYAFYQHLLGESNQRILTKEFVAACPIDVFVYNESNELVASIIDGRVSCSGNVMIALIDDTKVIRFYDDQDYRIEYIGTSAGEMDVTISEFNADEEVVRTVNYYDVALTNDKIYTIDVDDTILNATPYVLKDDSTGKTVDYDYDSLLNKDAAKHTVSIQSGSMIQNGEIFLVTEAVAGETIEIFSYVPEGSSFVCWESSNGEDIFADKTAISTTFIMPDEDIVIKATFQTDNINRASIAECAEGGLLGAKVMLKGLKPSTTYVIQYGRVGLTPGDHFGGGAAIMIFTTGAGETTREILTLKCAFGCYITLWEFVEGATSVADFGRPVINGLAETVAGHSNGVSTITNTMTYAANDYRASAATAEYAEDGLLGAKVLLKNLTPATTYVIQYGRVGNGSNFGGGAAVMVFTTGAAQTTHEIDTLPCANGCYVTVWEYVEGAESIADFGKPVFDGLAETAAK